MTYYYLLNTDFEIVTIIENYESFIWTDKYYEAGDFELYIPASQQALELYTEAVKKHWYIVRDDDDPSDARAMVVTSIESETDFEDGVHLSIKGNDLKSLLSRRIVWGKRTLAGDMEEELRALVKENAISPTISDRVIPNLELDDITGPIYDADGINIINSEIDGSDLDDAIIDTCKLFNAGWDIRIDRQRHRLKFRVFKGTDRSISQTAAKEDQNPYIIFSTDFENLLSTTYSIDTTNYKNVAYVEAEIEQLTDDKTDKSDETEKFDISQVAYPKKSDKLFAFTNPVGLDRFEMFVDGSSYVKDEYTDYQNMLASLLTTKGQTELEDYRSVINMSGKVVPNYTFVINEDYFIGDLVTVINEYGQRFDARVTQVTYTEERDTVSCVPTFTVESYDGKEDEDPKDYDEDDMRISEKTTETEYRVTENGEIRLREKGYITKTRVAYIKIDGVLTEVDRLTENNVTRDAVVPPTKYDI